MTNDYIPIKVILPVTSIGVFLTALDGSIVNVTLPVIANALNTTIDQVVWVVIIYLLTIVSFMGLGGSLGDNRGRKRVFQAGMFIFALGSLLCSLATSISFLILARVIQAFGAVGIQANGLALVITFIDPKIRGRAIGINSLVVAAAISAGPLLGGVLSELFGWQSIFWINIPIAIIGIIAVQRVIPGSQDKNDVSLDYLGVVLFALTSLFLVAGLKFSIEGNLWFISLLVLTPIIGYLFVQHEKSHDNPVLSVSLMKNRQIMFGAVAAILSFMAINAATILLPFYFSEALELNQTTIGLYLVVIPLALVFFGPPAGFLAEKFNTRYLSTLGAGLQATVTLVLAIVLLVNRSGVQIWQILLLVGIMASFLSLFTNTNGTRVMNASSPDELSIVSGILNLSRNVGFTLGSSLSPALFVLFRGQSNQAAFVDRYVVGMGLTFFVFSLFAFIGTLISWLRGEEGLIPVSERKGSSDTQTL